jgi:hypothetical protein
MKLTPTTILEHMSHLQTVIPNQSENGSIGALVDNGSSYGRHPSDLSSTAYFDSESAVPQKRISTGREMYGAFSDCRFGLTWSWTRYIGMAGITICVIPICAMFSLGVLIDDLIGRARGTPHLTQDEELSMLN